MVNLPVYIVFIISAAFAALGVVLAGRLRTRYGSDLFSSLLYYQVFIFTFGFYGIWGQIIIKAFLSDVVSIDLLERFSDISLLLGLPFLVFAWLMLVRFCREITGRKRSNWFILWFLGSNFIIVFTLGFLIASSKEIKTAVIIRYYFIGFQIIYAILSSILLFLPSGQKTVLNRHESMTVSFILLISSIAESILLLNNRGGIVTGLLFIVIFFSASSILPVYFSYSTVLSLLKNSLEKTNTFEEFCRKFEISSRESEIITEICNGLSNKEISEKLFITLQTVKDHTHRIYIKTNVRSRIQLLNLVNEMSLGKN